MSKNNKQKNAKNEKKKYKNPAKTIWGKVIITALAIMMALGSLISLIYLMITRG